MGVDYEAVYGIGVELDFNEAKTLMGESEYYYIGEFLDSMEKPEGLRYAEAGTSNYTGDDPLLYLIIDEPFSGGLEGLSKKIKTLNQFIDDLGLKKSSKIDVVGGLWVY